MPRLTTRINEQNYEYEVYLFNKNGQSMFIDQGKLKSLIIIDNFLNTFLKQQLSITDNNDTLQKTRYSDFGIPQSNQTDNIYEFMGNGLDQVSIFLKPILYSEEVVKDTSTLDPIFTIEERFIVTMIEDKVVSPQEKYKILHLTQENEYILQTTNSTFGTGIFKNTDKKEYQGKQIKECILQAIPDATISTTEWDQGQNRIFHCASKDESYIDTIEEILIKGISTNEDQLILSKTRSKEYRLLSMKNLYEKQVTNSTMGGKYFSETFILAEKGQMGRYDIPVNEPTIPYFKNTFIHNFNIIDHIEITPKDWTTSYSQFKSSIVTAYDNTTSTFKVKSFPINKTIEDYKTKYVDPFLKIHNAKSNIITSPHMLSGNLVDINLSVYGDNETIKQYGSKKELSEFILLNDIIRFKTKGLPHRKSGMFIEVKPENISNKNEYNRRYAGIYFVLEVSHALVGNNYETVITATKTYKTE